MDAWSSYMARTGAKGEEMRDASLRREKRFLTNKLGKSLSYHPVTIDGNERSVAIINSDNLNTKTICSMPGEDLPHGGLVYWMEQYWLITAKDYNNEVYTRATMKQCNYLLKWVADDMSIVSRWCIVEDGTKYLTGEYGDRNYVVERGDARATITLAKDPYSVKLNRGNRFLIDDYDSPNVLAYQLTKPFKLGGAYNGKGVLSFVLTECNTEDTDNLELHIANYYKYFPREDSSGDMQKENTPAETVETQSGKRPGDEAARKVWI